MIYTKDQLQEVRQNLFDTANSFAGDVTGDVAVVLHDASNGIQCAINTISNGMLDKDAKERYLEILARAYHKAVPNHKKICE